MFLTNPSINNFHSSLSEAVYANPTINFIFATTDIEKEQGLKNNLINYQTVYKDYKLFSIGLFKTSFSTTNLDDEFSGGFKNINEEYDNKIISLGIFGHVFVFKELSNILYEYKTAVEYKLNHIEPTMVISTSSTKFDFWKDYYKYKSHNFKIGSKYKDGIIIYLLRENDNINLYTDSINSIKFNKDTIHGILIKDINETEESYITHNGYITKKSINWNQFEIGVAVKNNVEFFNAKSNDEWFIPTLKEMHLIYLAKNYLNNIKNIYYPSSSLTIAPGLSTQSWGSWVKDFNKGEIYFEPLFTHRKQILIKYF
jgi:hypothetical protein